MLEYNIKAFWEYYKATENFKAAKNRFESFSCEDLVFYYNPILAKHIKPDLLDDMAETLYCYGFSESEIPTTNDEAVNCLYEIASYGVSEENEWVIKPSDYEMLVSLMFPFSYAAFKFSPDFFYPYLYGLRFVDFSEALDILGISTPAIPKRKDYKDRYDYYWSFCKIFSEVRVKYNLNAIETCIFMYDFIPQSLIKREVDLSKPTQCWFIGGLCSPSEEILTESYWQVNKDTRPGDILVHYETTPKSSVTAIWQALSNGYIDPFFHYHSCGKIGKRINIPHITLNEIKQDEYFSQFPLTKKNFQGVNGFPMPAEAYQRLLDIIKSKGFDISVLPTLYAPTLQNDDSIQIEKNVEDFLLIPFLESLGLKENINFKRQVGIHVGRGYRVFPDFIVDYKKFESGNEARILIEAKYYMKNRKDVEDAFRQARSYALNLKSDYIILCDRYVIMIFEKKNGDFDKLRATKYIWSEIENPDIFNKLKSIFTI